ncbi:hypothetical protein SAMN04487886_100824 [Clostridium sp. DSM 8431]|nr:hypothetical protein SAMN04487886_100824 [Clostridium sp. DSM 8431]
MNLNVFEKYINLCGVFSIKPSWKGLSEYCAHKNTDNKITRRSKFSHVSDYRHVRN